jgi:hypothetical protein
LKDEGQVHLPITSIQEQQQQLQGDVAVSSLKSLLSPSLFLRSYLMYKTVVLRLL